MTDIPALIAEMRLGKFPDWSPRLIMRIGDALQTKLDELDLLTEDTVDQRLKEHTEMVTEEHRLRQILVDFGALDPGDEITGPLDILEILLPPREA